MKSKLYKFRALVALCMLLCVFGCSSNVPQNIIDVEKALDGGVKEIMLSDVASEIEYVAINTGDDVLYDFKRLDFIEAKDGFYMVPMPLEPAPFYKFSSDGNLISKFNRQGRAKDEYSLVAGVSYSEAKDALVVSDMAKKILVYNGNGDCLYSVMLDPEVCGVWPKAILMGDDLVLFTKSKDNSKYCAVTVDTAGNVLKERVLIEYPQDKAKGSENAYVYDSNVRICNFSYSDSLYTFDGENLHVVYPLHLGKYGEGDVQKIKFGGVNYECEQFLLMQTIKTPQSYPNISHEERLSYVYFNKKSGECCRVSKDNNGKDCFVNDLDGGAPFWPKTVANGKMYQMIDAIEFIELAEQCSSEKMKAVAATLNENSNPVLVIASLK